MSKGWVKNAKERKKIQRAYAQAEKELRNRFPIEIPIMNFNSVLKKYLSENEVYTQENLNYLRGFFRKNNILTFDSKTLKLKWNTKNVDSF